MYERQEVCVLLMRCRLDLDELGNTSGHLNLKVSKTLQGLELIHWSPIEPYADDQYLTENET